MLLICLIIALSGCLPLVIVLYKKKRVQQILTRGNHTVATVVHVRPAGYTTRSPGTDLVTYAFVASNGMQYYGLLTCKPGKFQLHEQLTIAYLPDNPKRNTLKGAWGSPAILVFVIVVAVAIAWMAYKLYQSVLLGEL